MAVSGKKLEVILHYSQSSILPSAFLEKHKSETVILTVKSDAGSTVGLEHAVAQFIAKK